MRSQTEASRRAPSTKLAALQSRLDSEKGVPETAKDQGRKSGAYCQQREHRWAGFRLPRFPRRFDDYAVLFRWHDTSLDFRRLARTVKDGRLFDIAEAGARRRIFGSVAYRLCGGV